MGKKRIPREQQLALNHQKYITNLLETHHTNTDFINIIKFHYTSAFIHGYKHGKEDANKRS
jgi:hypothetical protein